MPIESLSPLLPANLESVAMVILIVVAGLLLESMVNRAVKVALNRTKLEGLAASF